MNHPAMYPKIAVVDPELTLTVPPQVTASTGLDVLCHAVESYWSVNHQPVCAACSVHAARLVFDWLEKAYRDGNDLEAREKMAEASIVAGVAFSHPPHHRLPRLLLPADQFVRYAPRRSLRLYPGLLHPL